MASNNYTPDLHNTPLPGVPPEIQFLHELRNPLTNIDLCVSLLQEPANETDTKKYLNIISHSTAIIKSIISNKSIELDDNVQKRSLNKILDEALEMALDRIALLNIKVKKHYSEGDSSVAIDEAGIKTVFLNIIINAIEAMPSENGTLILNAKIENDKYVVTIEDNGIGIKKEDLKKLFDPYYTSKPNGMGLGLATTLAILRINNASIKVESVENKGTRFIIFFDN